MILTCLLIALGVIELSVIAFLLGALANAKALQRLVESQSAAFDNQRKELDAALQDALKTNERLQEAVLDFDASRMKAIRAWQKNGFPGRLHEALGISETELHAYVYGPRVGQQEQASLNSEGFIAGLNEDMRKALQREEIAAKIEAYRNSSSTAPLHGYIGISEAELYAFLEQDEASGIIEKQPDEDRTHPSEPA